MSERAQSQTETECRYCGEDYSDPNGIASDDYMQAGHWLNECDQIPALVRARINAPPTERYA